MNQTNPDEDRITLVWTIDGMSDVAKSLIIKPGDRVKNFDALTTLQPYVISETTIKTTSS